MEAEKRWPFIISTALDSGTFCPISLNLLVESLQASTPGVSSGGQTLINALTWPCCLTGNHWFMGVWMGFGLVSWGVHLRACKAPPSADSR